MKTSQEIQDMKKDGLQKYIDGVALNILYQNYHKSTNGIWSKAEVDDVTDNGCGDDIYVVNVDFGCQDDTRNESYREQIYVYQKEGEWTMLLEFKLIDEEDPADRDDRLYKEEQDHIAMEKAKENK